MTIPALRMTKTVTWLAVLCVLVLACGGTPQLDIGQPAPDLRLPDTQGQQLALSDLGGQVILLNFWATWCEPCKDEMPIFQSLLDTYGEAGLAVVLVALGDEPAEVQGYISDHSYSFISLVDEDLVADRVYLTNTLPSSFLIDADGTLRRIWIGPVEDGENVAQQLVSLLTTLPTSAVTMAATSPSPTWTPLPTQPTTPTPSPTPTPSLTPTATLTPVPTRTPILGAPTTAVPPASPSPAATASPEPSDTPTPEPPTPTDTPTWTPTPKVYATPSLLSPDDGAQFLAGIGAQLVWHWDGQLSQDEYFDVRVWQGGASHTGIAWTKDTTIDFLGEPGITYSWAVAVIRGEAGQMLEQLSPESQARALSWSQPAPTEPPVFGLSLSGGGSKTAPPGQLVVFDVQLTNTGNVEDTFNVSMGPSVPGGWDAMFCFGDKCYRGGVQPVTVPAGGVEPIQVKIESSIDAPSGQVGSVTLLASSQGDPSQSAALTSTLTVE